MAHTLAPWKHENDCTLNDPVTGKPLTGARIYGNGGFLVAEVFHAEPEDVKLIVAAPQLERDRDELEMILKDMVSEFAKFAPKSIRHPRAFTFNQARALLGRIKHDRETAHA